MNDEERLGAEAVTTALEDFAQLIGIPSEELACYNDTACQHLMRQMLACRTSSDITTPQKVFALVDPGQVKNISFESDERVWDISKDVELPPAFYTYVAAHVELTPDALCNTAFKKFTVFINTKLPAKGKMNNQEAFLMYQLLNARNARDVLEYHFKDTPSEINMIHDTLVDYKRKEYASEHGQRADTRERVGDALGAFIKGLYFPMFSNGRVYIGAQNTSPKGSSGMDASEQWSSDANDTSYTMEWKSMDQPRTLWSPEIETVMRKDAALESFRQLNGLQHNVSRRNIWKQAILSAVVPTSRREASPMSTLIGRKQHMGPTWDSGESWLKTITFQQWDALWNELNKHVDAEAILSSGRATNQTQTLYNALCRELGHETVRETYTPSSFLRLLISSHLPESHQGRLLTVAQLESRATLRALNAYKEQCPHVGRSLLNALCDS